MTRTILGNKQAMNRTSNKWTAAALLAVAAILLVAWMIKAVPLLALYPKPAGPPAYQSLPRQGHLLLAVLGDTKDNTPPLEKILRAKKADGALIMGDFATRGSTLSLAFVVSRIEAAAGKMPWMAAIGNHEKGFYGDARLFTEFFGPPNYWWRFGRMLFVVIDDVNDNDWQNQLTWLTRTLREQEKPGDQLYLFLHRPPKVEGVSHDLGAARTRDLAQALSTHALTATFSSHRHDNEKLVFLGAPLYISGQAGAPQEADPPEYGYLLLDCDSDRCEVSHVVVQVKSKTNVLTNIIIYDYFFVLPLISLFLVIAALLQIKAGDPKRNPQPNPAS